MSDVVGFPGVSKLDRDPDRVMDNCKGVLKGVVIVGEHEDGTEFFASSYADGGDALWHLARAQKKLLETVD